MRIDTIQFGMRTGKTCRQGWFDIKRITWDMNDLMEVNESNKLIPRSWRCIKVSIPKEKRDRYLFYLNTRCRGPRRRFRNIISRSKKDRRRRDKLVKSREIQNIYTEEIRFAYDPIMIIKTNLSTKQYKSYKLDA